MMKKQLLLFLMLAWQTVLPAGSAPMILAPEGGSEPAFTPDGKAAIFCKTDAEGESRLYRVELESPGRIKALPLVGTSPRRISGCGRMAMLSGGGFAPRIRLFDPATGEAAAELPNLRAFGPIFDCGAGMLGIPGVEGIVVWNVTKNHPVERPLPAGTAAVSPDGKSLLYSSMNNGQPVIQLQRLEE